MLTMVSVDLGCGGGCQHRHDEQLGPALHSHLGKVCIVASVMSNREAVGRKAKEKKSVRMEEVLVLRVFGFQLYCEGRGRNDDRC